MKRSELEKIVRESLLEIEAEKNGIKKPETSDGAMTPEEEEMIKKYEEEEANKYALEKEEPLEETETDIMAKAREIVKNYKEQEDVVAEATRIVEAWKKGKLLIENKSKEKPAIKILKDLYHFDKLGSLAAKDDVDEKYHKGAELVFKKGKVVKDDTQHDDSEYEMITKSKRLKKGTDYTLTESKEKPRLLENKIPAKLANDANFKKLVSILKQNPEAAEELEQDLETTLEEAKKYYDYSDNKPKEISAKEYWKGKLTTYGIGAAGSALLGAMMAGGFDAPDVLEMALAAATMGGGLFGALASTSGREDEDKVKQRTGMTESKKQGRKILKESADPVVNKHSTGLLKALTARSKYPEDEQAYRAVEKHLKAIATELGLDASLPFMEDEMYSGKAKPKEALEYTKEMFNDWLEDTGMTESKKQGRKILKEAYRDLEDNLEILKRCIELGNKNPKWASLKKYATDIHNDYKDSNDENELDEAVETLLDEYNPPKSVIPYDTGEDSRGMTESKKQGRKILKEAMDSTYSISDEVANSFRMDIAKLKKEADTKYGFSKYKEGTDYKWAIGRGDDFPNALVVLNPKMTQDPKVTKFITWVEEDEEDMTETKKKHSRMMNETGKFYAPTYLEQKYGEATAKKIEAEIDELDANSWDRFTAMESAEEVEDYIVDIKDMLGLTETKKKHSKMMNEATVKEITLTGDEDWDKISRLFGKEVENYDKDLLEKGKKLVKVSDRFGWDYLTQLQDGRIALPDRNTGFTNITTQPVKDVNTFVGKFMEAFEVDEEDMTETKKKHSKMMKEASNSDREAIENWYHRTNFYIDDLSPEEIEKGIQDHYEEWTAVKDQYNSIEDYFADVERNGDWY